MGRRPWGWGQSGGFEEEGAGLYLVFEPSVGQVDLRTFSQSLALSLEEASPPGLAVQWAWAWPKCQPPDAGRTVACHGLRGRGLGPGAGRLLASSAELLRGPGPGPGPTGPWLTLGHAEAC